MTWSFSAHATFRKCPRQWHYKQHVAHWKAKDPLRREAYLLSKLEGLPAWRGKIVDTIISETIIPSLSWSQPCNLSAALRKADALFDAQRAERLTNGGFYEIAYGQPLTEEKFSAARGDVHAALDNFYRAIPVWTLLRSATRLMPQRSLCFHHGAATVRVVPDLIAFHHQSPPTIFDWKVSTYALRDYWLQLACGAIAVTRCDPHKDWPAGATTHPPQSLKLLEVQLLTGDVREHTVTEADVQDAEDLIAISSAEMNLACAGNHKDKRPEDLPAAQDPKACEYCSFKKLCWEVS